MELNDARILIVGATGEVGSAVAAELAGRGARLALAGRDPERLAAAGRGHDAPTIPYVAGGDDPVGPAAALIGELDAVVVAIGVPAFGPAAELPDAVAEELVAVNLLAPMALVRSALERFRPAGAGTIAVLSAVVAEHPTAGMAAYSASKAGLSGYLAAVRREVRRQGITVLDVRPPHLDTGFAERSLAGSAPELPDPFPVALVAEAIVDAMVHDQREVAWGLKERELITR